MNYYQLLQVDPKASQEVIKGVYRVLLKQVRIHPDLGGDEDEAKAINEAYGVLGHPERRAQYDLEMVQVAQYHAAAPPPQYILFCNSCGKPNRLRDEALIPRARCGSCNRRLAPSGATLGGAGHERPFRLGMYLFEKGLHDRALREFQLAVRTKPDNATYRYWLGRCFYQKRSHDKAAVEFKAAIQVKPDSFQFHFWLGQSLSKGGDLGAAAGAFDQAAKLRPEHAATQHRLGTVHYHAKHFDQAAAAFQKAAQLDPASLQSHRWAGLSYYAMEDNDAALQAFRNAERLSPGDPFSEKYIRLLTERTA